MRSAINVFKSDMILLWPIQLLPQRCKQKEIEKMPKTIFNLARIQVSDYHPVQLLFELQEKLEGFNRDDFADLMGVQPQTVRQWCSKNGNPNPQARQLAGEIKARLERDRVL